jgi:multidrug efflux pump subunit AcrB
LSDLKNAIQAANQSHNQNATVDHNQQLILQVGSFFDSPEDIAQLVVAVYNDAPVYLKDVAKVSQGPDQPEQYVGMGMGPASPNSLDGQTTRPAITIAIAKKAGENAVEIADNVTRRLDQLKGTFIPDGVNVNITRNYGKTANDKANKLISKLIFATASVVLLVFFTLGGREAVIVGVAVVITLTITLFASWAYGFTINRVSLFALIFSIGILVDDAIVVVENIHRHLQQGDTSLLEAIPKAVDEVGGPTILATFTVIAALLPMAFVTGLMGPYMSPIPINASMGMLISLAVAFIISPWMANKLLPASHPAAHHSESALDRKLQQIFQKSMSPFLGADKGRKKRWLLFAVVMLLILISVLLPVFKLVVLKMLPFDNKSEFQIVLDMPEGTSVEKTNQVLDEIGAYLETVPEVTDYQVYAGTASPINFNGLVRQYYLRANANAGDIQVNLMDKDKRDRQSHDIATSVREPIRDIVNRYHGDVKIVEVPPGPPVLAPIVAEIYGLDYQGQRRIANEIRTVFENTKDITDVDDSVESQAHKLVIDIDTSKAALAGISQQSIVNALSMAVSGSDISYLHGDQVKYPTPIRIEVSNANKADIDELLDLRVHSRNGSTLPLADFVSVRDTSREYIIYHKDLLPFTYVTGDLAGELDSPLYGMFDIFAKLKDKVFDGEYEVEQYFINQPSEPYRYSLKWDGEWQITYETFRDMGIAYAVGIILIYLLVVAQFRSYIIPLIIMVPIPLTVIGVMPGHALLQSQFTATSMIGMIALAGIIVRNSILLVDFINEQLKAGVNLQEAVIRSGAVRAKPIILTGLAAMLGAFFILDDPIFNGLAISLIFGVLISTLLTLFIIPVLYYSVKYKKV